MQKRKLQVFVSSTYTDLKEERQAAVQAILDCGHIPAGMELFSAGDEAQMKVIKRWIDESDVYLLILGGRYGSINPKSRKSYTHLEYEYAVEKKKPLFAIVINDDYLDKKVKESGKGCLELENPKLLKEFRELVLSKISKFFEDKKDIALAIHQKLGELARQEDLSGWVKGDNAVNNAAIAEELAKLSKENAELRKKISNKNDEPIDGGLSYNEWVADLSENKITLAELERFENKLKSQINQLIKNSNIETPNALALFICLGTQFENKLLLHHSNDNMRLIGFLENKNLIKEAGHKTDYIQVENNRTIPVELFAYSFTSIGQTLHSRLKRKFSTLNKNPK